MSTAAAPPMTPCCCWAPAPARSRPPRTIWTSAVLAVLRRPVRAQMQADAEGVQADRRSPWPARPARTTPSPQPASSPGTAWSNRAVRSGPELGTGAGRRSGHGTGHLDANRIPVSFNGSPVCVDRPERGCPGRRPVGADIPTSPSFNLGDGERDHQDHRPVLHAYVEENSAYSS